MNRDSSSRILRANHHSLNNKQSPISVQNSKMDSISKPRKLSTASTKQNMPDIEKLINDLKIAPHKNHSDCIKKIMVSLRELERFEIVSDEVRAVTLLLESIQKKITSHGMAASRARNSLKSSEINQKKANTLDFKLYNENDLPTYRADPHKNQSTDKKSKREDKNILRLADLENNNSLNEVSPIKQMGENSSSRIIYSNMSLKDLQKNIGSEAPNKNQTNKSKPEPNASMMKITISQFEEEESGDEVSRLNDEIKYLQDLLAKKTMSQAPVPSSLKKQTKICDLFKKKSNKY